MYEAAGSTKGRRPGHFDTYVWNNEQHNLRQGFTSIRVEGGLDGLHSSPDIKHDSWRHFHKKKKKAEAFFLFFVWMEVEAG